MKIALLSPLPHLYRYGGAPIANRALLQGFALLGHDISLLTLHPPEARELPEGFAVDDGVAHGRLDSVDARAAVDPRVLISWVRQERLVRAFLQQQRPDLVFVSEDLSRVPGSMQAGRWLRAALGEVAPGRVGYLAHTVALLPGTDGSFVVNGAAEALRALEDIGAVFAVSEFIRGSLASFTRRAVTVVRPPSYGFAGLPTVLDAAAGTDVVMVNPSLVKGRTIFCALARRFPSLCFRAVPTWATNDEDRAALASAGVVLSPPGSMDDVLRNAACLLVPSLWAETFGQVVIDAMARGIPVAASALGGLVEAKLGVEALVPVRAIESYESAMDERGTPRAIVPEQDLAPWVAVVDAWMHDAALRRSVGQRSAAAARPFVQSTRDEPARILAELQRAT